MGAWLRLDSYGAYAALAVVAVLIYTAVQFLSERRSRGTKLAARAAGLDEPPSLHPIIDPARCIGCGACARACPEGKVLGLIDGKAELIEPTTCIGHGACKSACPTNAITLVFGTATRGVEIPHVTPRFESNVPGIFIAGELGGMGLIANAIEQGRQAMESIAKLDGLCQRGRYDVVIIGCGPAGLSASLAARAAKLDFVTIEQESFGGTVGHYPRGKMVTTRPVKLALVGKVRWRRARKERLLELWRDAARRYRLPLRCGERVAEIVSTPDGGFELHTHDGGQVNFYRTRAVLLATGRRGSPKKLGVPGEELPKVVYALIGPAQYKGQSVLVVGGGDSAVETAIALAREPGVHVTVAIRGDGFVRAKAASRQRIETMAERGRLRILRRSHLTAIHPAAVDLEVEGRPQRIPNHAVIVCAGGMLPSEFLGRLGIHVETKYGTA